MTINVVLLFPLNMCPTTDFCFAGCARGRWLRGLTVCITYAHIAIFINENESFFYAPLCALQFLCRCESFSAAQENKLTAVSFGWQMCQENWLGFFGHTSMSIIVILYFICADEMAKRSKFSFELIKCQTEFDIWSFSKWFHSKAFLRRFSFWRKPCVPPWSDEYIYLICSTCCRIANIL